MGRTSKGKGQLDDQFEMFVQGEMGEEPRQGVFNLGGRYLDGLSGRPPDQTDSKSRLIASYLSKFQLVTKGGLYIDGFAGPQSRDHEEAWTARRVLELQPPRLRTFWLCELEPRGLLQLRKLKARHHRNPSFRRVFVLEGDFNQSVKSILSNDRLTRKAAIFALLDQRNTECHWSTVRALAARAGRSKVELLYFLGTSWLHRSLKSSSRPERLREIDLWWGGSEWDSLLEKSQVEVVAVMAHRFAKELGYQHVKAYPIMLDDDGKKAAFHLIHASDHPEAPKLMRRAYIEICGIRDGVDLGVQGIMDF